MLSLKGAKPEQYWIAIVHPWVGPEMLSSAGVGPGGTLLGHFQNPALFGGWQLGGFPKGWFRRMFPRNENRNEGTFGCSTGTKTGTRVRSHAPPER